MQFSRLLLIFALLAATAVRAARIVASQQEQLIAKVSKLQTMHDPRQPRDASHRLFLHHRGQPDNSSRSSIAAESSSVSSASANGSFLVLSGSSSSNVNNANNHNSSSSSSSKSTDNNNHHGRSNNALEVPTASEALQTLLRANNRADGECYIDEDGSRLGCASSCRCGWGDQCYPKRFLWTDVNNHNELSVVNVGVCGKAMASLAFMSIVIFAILLFVIITVRMLLQKREPPLVPPYHPPLGGLPRIKTAQRASRRSGRASLANPTAAGPGSPSSPVRGLTGDAAAAPFPPSFSLAAAAANINTTIATTVAAASTVAAPTSSAPGGGVEDVAVVGASEEAQSSHCQSDDSLPEIAGGRRGVAAARRGSGRRYSAEQWDSWQRHDVDDKVAQPIARA
mmetsp:Transcript_21870/g.47699  ORF Transcript_21870/g.47699 Transcript_21870/m.47699 type:complete len:397 (+) Transcript_21870:377-1567(+)